MINMLISIPEFIKSIGTELIITGVAAVIVSLATWLFTKFKKSNLYHSMFKSGVLRVYPNQDEAKNDILKHLKQAKVIKVFCIRGYSFVQPDREFYTVLRDIDLYSDASIQFCLADPEGEAVMSRAHEIPGKPEEVYISEVKQTINTVYKRSKASKNIELRLHNEDPIFRIYIIDDIIYLGFFQKGKVAKDSRIMKIDSSCPLYNALIKYYETIWEKSKNVEGEYV